jgi:hypothetical protein
MTKTGSIGDYPPQWQRQAKPSQAAIVGQLLLM